MYTAASKVCPQRLLGSPVWVARLLIHTKNVAQLYVVIQSGGFVWNTKRHSAVVALSVDAGLIANARAVHQAQWIQNLLQELHFEG